MCAGGVPAAFCLWGQSGQTITREEGWGAKRTMCAKSVPAVSARGGGKPIAGRTSPDYSLKRSRGEGACYRSRVSLEGTNYPELAPPYLIPVIM